METHQLTSGSEINWTTNQSGCASSCHGWEVGVFNSSRWELHNLKTGERRDGPYKMAAQKDLRWRGGETIWRTRVVDVWRIRGGTIGESIPIISASEYPWGPGHPSSNDADVDRWLWLELDHADPSKAAIGLVDLETREVHVHLVSQLTGDDPVRRQRWHATHSDGERLYLMHRRDDGDPSTFSKIYWVIDQSDMVQGTRTLDFISGNHMAFSGGRWCTTGYNETERKSTIVFNFRDAIWFPSDQPPEHLHLAYPYLAVSIDETRERQENGKTIRWRHPWKIQIFDLRQPHVVIDEWLTPVDRQDKPPQFVAWPRPVLHRLPDDRLICLWHGDVSNPGGCDVFWRYVNVPSDPSPTVKEQVARVRARMNELLETSGELAFDAGDIDQEIRKLEELV